jgi:hypothetical protein
MNSLSKYSVFALLTNAVCEGMVWRVLGFRGQDSVPFAYQDR